MPAASPALHEAPLVSPLHAATSSEMTSAAAVQPASSSIVVTNQPSGPMESLRCV